MMPKAANLCTALSAPQTPSLTECVYLHGVRWLSGAGAVGQLPTDCPALGDNVHMVQGPNKTSSTRAMAASRRARPQDMQEPRASTAVRHAGLDEGHPEGRVGHGKQPPEAHGRPCQLFKRVEKEHKRAHMLLCPPVPPVCARRGSRKRAVAAPRPPSPPRHRRAARRRLAIRAWWGARRQNGERQHQARWHGPVQLAREP